MKAKFYSIYLVTQLCLHNFVGTAEKPPISGSFFTHSELLGTILKLKNDIIIFKARRKQGFKPSKNEQLLNSIVQESKRLTFKCRFTNNFS